jgi:FK506-binding protein 4/5
MMFFILLDENELFERCTDHKNDANRIFKLGRLRTAFRRYKKSIDYLIIAEQIVNEKIKRLEQNPDDSARNELTILREKLLAIKSQLYSNLSLLQLKSKSYDMAVINCSKCLSIDSNNVKALFRRGQARMNLKDYDEAIGDFNRALELEPDNVEVKSNLAACEKMKKDYERELAANLKKLFT